MNKDELMIPDSHKDLLERPVVVSLATQMPNGFAHVTPVWMDYDGEFIRINSAAGRQKDKDMRRNSKVTLLAIDPDNPYRWMELRGTVEVITEEGAVDHINRLSAKYRSEPDYYRGNPSLRGKETRVMYKIRLSKVVTSG